MGKTSHGCWITVDLMINNNLLLYELNRNSVVMVKELSPTSEFNNSILYHPCENNLETYLILWNRFLMIWQMLTIKAWLDICSIVKTFCHFWTDWGGKIDILQEYKEIQTI